MRRSRPRRGREVLELVDTGERPGPAARPATPSGRTPDRPEAEPDDLPGTAPPRAPSDPDGADGAIARRRARVSVAVALLAAALAGWLGRDLLVPGEVTPPPDPRARAERFVDCHTAGVVCEGPRTYRFALVSPVRWEIPRGFGVADGGSPTATRVESHWTHDGHPAGVAVVELVRPAGPQGGWVPGPGRHPGPRAFAAWLASRPDLSAGSPRRTTLAGRVAWQVRVRLAAGAGPGAGICPHSRACHPVTVSDQAITEAPGGGGLTGIWGDMVADYTFVRLPSGTAMIWSWALGGDTAALEQNRRLVTGVTWPAG